MIKKNIITSLNLIHNLIESSTYTIKSEIPELNNKIITLQKESRNFSFNVTLATTERAFSNEIIYKKNPAFKLISSKKTLNYSIPLNGSFFLKSSENSDFTINIETKLSELSTYNFENETAFFYRILIPIEPNPVLFSNFQCFNFQSDEPLNQRYLIKIKLSNIEYHFFTFEKDNKQYWCIDSTELISLAEFTNTAFSIYNAYGIFTGNLYLNEVFIISSDTNDFSANLEFQYKTIRESLKSDIEIVTTNAYSILIPFYKNNHLVEDENNIIKWRQLLSPISDIVFSNMVDLLLRNPKLSRSVFIILEGNLQPLELKAATFCIAFEAITATIKDVFGIESPNVIDNSIWDEKVKKQFENLLSTMLTDNSIDSNQKDILINKLQNWNQPTNRDKLTAPFSKFNYSLSIDEKKCVDNRNKFLHGSLPFNEKNEDMAFQELYHISLVIHKLIHVLMLKSAGFEGYIINHPKLNSHITQKEFSDDLFLLI